MSEVHLDIGDGMHVTGTGAATKKLQDALYERDALAAELAEAKRAIERQQALRDDWCEQYTKARDDRDRLRAAIEAHLEGAPTRRSTSGR